MSYDLRTKIALALVVKLCLLGLIWLAFVQGAAQPQSAASVLDHIAPQPPVAGQVLGNNTQKGDLK